MTLKIDETRCVRCGVCITDCPAEAFIGEGEHIVGQSRVFDAVNLDNDRCTECGECTASQFWCPAEAIYDESVSATETPFGTRVRAGREGDGKKYSEFVYQYKPGDDPRVDEVPEDMPIKTVTSFKGESFRIPGAPWTWGYWMHPHAEPFLEIGHPPHIHREAELLFHIGGDPYDPTELGAEIEFYMGVEMEKHVITKSCVIYIPPNVVHCPWRPLYAKRPWWFMEINLGAVHTEKGFHHLLPAEMWDLEDLQKPMFAEAWEQAPSTTGEAAVENLTA